MLLPFGAAVAGVTAAASANHYLRDQARISEQAVRQRYATQDVVVASRDLPRGQILDRTTLAVRAVPRAFVPADAVPAASASELIGGRTAISLRRGTPVAQAALLAERTSAHLSEVLPAGQRALTIQVDQVNAVGGHLSAGDAVDLYYSQREQSSTVLVPLLENVHVLATGSAMEQPLGTEVDDGFSTVTLQLEAEQAARVVLAEQTGRITVLLRAAGDKALAEVRTRNSQQLLAPARRSLSPNDNQYDVEVLTGGRGEATPARSWLKVGAGLGAAPREAT
jgi:pilus assembly protein CpaB